MNTKKTYSADVKLGIFVFLGLLLIFAAIFFIGREKKLFDSRVMVKSHFSNAAGLSVGANVMLAGVVVGHVSSINFPKLRPDMPGLIKDVTVEMEVSKSAMDWIREDSLASIDSKGLLGDKIINISIGSPELPQIQKGGMLKPSQAIDFNRALEKAQEILTNLGETAADARDVFKSFVSKGGEDSLLSSAKSLQEILEEVKKGQGVIGALVYDKKTAQNTKDSIEKLGHLADSLSNIAKEVQDGKGILGSIIYDPRGKDTVEKFNTNLDQLAAMFKEIKDGKGIVHDLIYENNNGNFIRDLNKSAADIKSATTSLVEGEGTLGLLLKDKTIYQNIYGVLGDIKRNALLKAFVRFGISNSDNAKKND